MLHSCHCTSTHTVDLCVLHVVCSLMSDSTLMNFIGKQKKFTTLVLVFYEMRRSLQSSHQLSVYAFWLLCIQTYLSARLQ